MTTLPPIDAGTLLVAWRPSPPAITLAVAAGAWYLTRHRRLARTGQTWPRRRSAAFCTGILLYIWCANGFLAAYAPLLFWVWTLQVLTLFLLVPVVLMAGQPVELASRARSPDSGPPLLCRLTRSRPARLLAHPFIGPLVIPVLSGLLFFAHCHTLWNADPWIGTGLGAILIALGAVIAIPLTTADPTIGSLAAGAALGIGIFEMLTDAIPGIVLRLDAHLVTRYYATRHAPWAMAPLTDQKLSGAILWGVAEALDLPFLAIAFHQWMRADEHEAARHDAERRRATPDGGHSSVPLPATDSRHPDPGTAAVPRDEPWWLTDPQLRQRPGIADQPGSADHPERRTNPSDS